MCSRRKSKQEKDGFGWMRRYTRGREGEGKGEIDLSGVKQAKLSRAEEWTDKQRTKEVRGGRLAGGEDGEAAKREEKKMETAMGREGKGRMDPRVPSV